MIQATKLYSAVNCRQCREPIPVPAIVLQMEPVPQAEASEHGRPQCVFTLRCRVCESENLYRSSEIVEIEGEPKRRRFAAKALDRQGPLSRTANA